MPQMDGYQVLAALRAEKATDKTPFIFLTAKGERSDQRAGMNLGADDYLIKPVSLVELLEAIQARLERKRTHDSEHRPTFESPDPLQKLGLSAREAEILFWTAQGKTNEEIGMILSVSRATVKKHLENIYRKTGTEHRAAASLRALEVLSESSSAQRKTESKAGSRATD
jgi:DNA-binding NarL/FixJ family response regulator